MADFRIHNGKPPRIVFGIRQDGSVFGPWWGRLYYVVWRLWHRG